jgi:hypothetical protein
VIKASPAGRFALLAAVPLQFLVRLVWVRRGRRDRAVPPIVRALARSHASGLQSEVPVNEVARFAAEPSTRVRAGPAVRWAAHRRQSAAGVRDR